METNPSDQLEFVVNRFRQAIKGGVLCMCLTAASCAPSDKPAVVSTLDLPPHITYEVVTVDDQIREEVNQAQPEFTLNPAEDRSAWVRARFFFQTYTSGSPYLSENEFLSDPDSDDRFHFQVIRIPGSDFVKYIVSCQESAKDKEGAPLSPEAALNARNLARFLTEGQLELSLLEPQG